MFIFLCFKKSSFFEFLYFFFHLTKLNFFVLKHKIKPIFFDFKMMVLKPLKCIFKVPFEVKRPLKFYINECFLVPLESSMLLVGYWHEYRMYLMSDHEVYYIEIHLWVRFIVLRVIVLLRLAKVYSYGLDPQ